MIRVLIVDNHPTVREGLTRFLSSFSDLVIVGQAVNGADAIAQCEVLQPDVILMETALPEIDGLSALRIIHQQHPHIRVIMLSSSDNEHTIEEALKAGASTYLQKAAAVEEIVGAIHAALGS